jgi:hypothetical protein
VLDSAGPAGKLPDGLDDEVVVIETGADLLVVIESR